MRLLTDAPINRFRTHHAMFDGMDPDETGAFLLPAGVKYDGYRSSQVMRVLAGVIPKDAEMSPWGWDHVSISCKNRCPNWDEMMLVHRLCFKPDEMAIQYNMPSSKHINVHPFVLHLWRPHDVEIPVPPPIYV
jgi:hypothetical protein